VLTVPNAPGQTSHCPFTPCLLKVLVNNGGGGIFSFLPIAGELPEQQFTQLWATPQNVDLEGACGIQ